VEKKVAAWWTSNNIFEKVTSANKGKPIFAFLEGPPTANGFMHIGHARGRVYKDIVLRYMTMKGFDVWRRAGWDCQGLPTEIEVEKRLGISTKKDLEKIGLERFNEEANAVVDYYIEHWRAASERLALWLDYDTAYETRREEYMEHVWALLKKAYEEGILVQSLRVVPYCPRCETPLSQHELAQGYEEVTDPSVYVKMPLEDGTGHVIIWTTTPWTLPGNEAIAVDPDEEYAELQVGEERWFIALPLLERASRDMGVTVGRKRRTLRGKELVGKRYKHPLSEEVPAHRQHDLPAHSILGAEHVSMDEGTGFVHTAPAHGPEDFELGKRERLPIFCPVSTTGVFTEEGGKYAGLSVGEASRVILNDLREKNLLVKAGEIRHNYPLCWRCDTPLIHLASNQWFLRVAPIRNLMVEGNKQVKWWPEWAGSNRFGEWLINAEDWCISRTKVWGTPLNVWVCRSCGHKKVVGSRAELEAAEERPSVIKLHRPSIDQVVFRCDRCGERMLREPFVLDTWLDSGVAHIAGVDQLRNPDLFRRLFPYDFITEAIDQTRGWFYTLLFTSTLMFGQPPFRTVLNQGHVLDEEGKKMSKSKGNVVWSMEAFDRFGVDPLRFYLVSKAEPWNAVNFVPSEVSQVTEQFNILWNVMTFAQTYYAIDRFSPRLHTVESLRSYLKPEDVWLLSRVNSVIRRVTRDLDDMQIHSAARELRRFVLEDLSRTYVRSIRRRVWTEKETRDKLAAYATLHYALTRLILLLAPFVPYLSEMLFQELRLESDVVSVHLSSWPLHEDRYLNEEVEDFFLVVQDTLTAILAARQKAGRKLRRPVARIVITPKSSRAQQAFAYFEDLLQSMSNAFSLQVLEVGQKPAELIVKARPVLRKLGPRLGKRLVHVLRLLEEMEANSLKREVEGQGWFSVVLDDGSQVRLTAEDIQFEYQTPPHMVSSEGKFAEIYVDLSETDQLKSISMAKEFIRRIQVMRKELELNILDEIECLVYVPDEQVVDSLRSTSEYIEEETRSVLQLFTKKQELAEGYMARDWEVDGVQTTIAIRKALP